MSGLKQILVVDDHFEMLELLRSTLEMAGVAGAEYQVLGVPSAEEGFLELQRTPFDLLITDYRLPGMSGLELVARVKRYRPDMPVIMITGYAPESWEDEAKTLEIYRHFRKPLDTYELLEAVQSALQNRAPVAPRPSQPASDRPPLPYARRLDTLRADTGARQVLLARRSGEQLYASGEPIGAATAPVLVALAESMANSFVLAESLGNRQPLTIHYQAGQHVDLYAANVGREYFLVLLFDAQTRRGRIGTVWIFAQRAIGELVTLLPAVEPATEQPSAAGEAPPDEVPVVAADSPAETPEAELPPEPAAGTAAVAVEAEESEARGEEDAEPLELPELDWDDGTTADLDAFWESAVAEADDEAGSGLSLEEARRQGLLPPEFGQGDDDG